MSSSNSSSSLDLTIELAYNRDDGTRPWVYLRPRTAADPHTTDVGGILGVYTPVRIRDGRQHELRLDMHGFQLVQQETTLKTEDFYEGTVYSKEICELIKTTLGAAHVWEAMEPTVRNMTKSRGFPQSFNGLDPASGYVTEVHCDRNAVSAEDLFVASMADYPELQQYGRGRFVYIIAWRNISDTPIGNDNLAVCDETSLVKPDDYIISDLFTPSGHSVRRYHLNCRNSKQHRWYYFPQMKKSEVLLFKIFDSDTTRPARCTFHTSFFNPHADPSLPPRESIDMRCLAFFPDHEPNTCPPLGSEVESERYVIELLAKMRMVALFWPGLAGRNVEESDWLFLQVSRGSAGALASAASLAADPYNIVGLRDSSPALKSKVEELLLQGGLGPTLEAARIKIESLRMEAAVSTGEADATILSAADETGPLQGDSTAAWNVQIARLPHCWDNILCLVGGLALGLASSSWLDAAVIALAGILGFLLLLRK